MKTSLLKCIISILAVFYILFCLSSVIRYYALPHVNAMPQKKGILSTGSTIYDFVIPKTALFNENSVYFTYSLPTPSGNRYIAVIREVSILSSDTNNVAITVSDISDDWLIITSDTSHLNDYCDVIIDCKYRTHSTMCTEK